MRRDSSFILAERAFYAGAMTTHERRADLDATAAGRLHRRFQLCRALLANHGLNLSRQFHFRLLSLAIAGEKLKAIDAAGCSQTREALCARGADAPSAYRGASCERAGAGDLLKNRTVRWNDRRRPG